MAILGNPMHVGVCTNNKETILQDWKDSLKCQDVLHLKRSSFNRERLLNICNLLSATQSHKVAYTIKRGQVWIR